MEPSCLSCVFQSCWSVLLLWVNYLSWATKRWKEFTIQLIDREFIMYSSIMNLHSSWQWFAENFNIQFNLIQLTYFLTNLENNGLIYSIRLRVYYELVQLRSAFWVNYLWRRQSSPHNAIGWFMPQQCLLKVDFRAKRLATSRRKAVPKLSKSSKGNTGGMVSDILWPSTD